MGVRISLPALKDQRFAAAGDNSDAIIRISPDHVLTTITRVGPVMLSVGTMPEGGGGVSDYTSLDCARARGDAAGVRRIAGM